MRLLATRAPSQPDSNAKSHAPEHQASHLFMAFGGYFSPVTQDEGRESEYSEPWE